MNSLAHLGQGESSISSPSQDQALEKRYGKGVRRLTLAEARLKIREASVIVQDAKIEFAEAEAKRWSDYSDE
jgi:hypothetical protein